VSWLAAAVALAVAPAHAQPHQSAARALQQLRFSTVPELHPGAWELGLSAAATRVEGTSTATIALRVARFAAAGAGRAAFEAELGHTHLGPLDALEIAGSLGWLAHPRPGPAYPFLAIAGGVRQEWLGSFRLARYPVGLNAGVRLLAGPGALVRIEYRWRRLLNDPVADFTEQQVMTGLSLLLGNRP
jgi:hypothetical protein